MSAEKLPRWRALQEQTNQARRDIIAAPPNARPVNRHVPHEGLNININGQNRKKD